MVEIMCEALSAFIEGDIHLLDGYVNFKCRKKKRIFQLAQREGMVGVLLQGTSFSLYYKAI
ncbi:MAG: hypothetical protein ACSLEL_05465 [Candidatus Malihini olakiniferum]